MQLFSENEKLKEENKFLKLNESKKSKIQYARIKEIRNIIANMASRIAYLEGFHAAKKKQSKEKEKIQTSL